MFFACGVDEELRMTVLPDEYMGKLVEYGIMKMFAICAVDETNQAWSEEDDFQGWHYFPLQIKYLFMISFLVNINVLFVLLVQLSNHHLT